MKKLSDILNGKVANRLYPFLCVYGDETEEMLVDAVEHIYNSGARGLCVESKRSPHFCKDHWWFTMDTVLREAKKYGIKVWMIDEPYVPSGYANGAVKDFPHLKKHHLIETHTDVLGPMPSAKMLLKRLSPNDRLVGAFAYKRADGATEDLTEEYIDLTDTVEGDMVYFDIPDGLYRVFAVYDTQTYADNYVDYFNRESTKLALSAVYEPHYERYKEYFGNTFEGFFSDEPAFRNQVFVQGRGVNAFSESTVGRQYVSMPWGESVWERMSEALGRKDPADLVALWFNVGEIYSEIRCAYMDAITSLFDENFNSMLRKWCAERGVIYTGHIVEDAGMHARMGGGSGHYFRSMNSYEMSGVDIVLHQIFPGYAHSRHTASCGGGFCQTDFFHYVLAQLAASDSHAHPQKTGKTLCEIFGAYGWGEDLAMMKWLIDFMLVRGVTNFVPHSFTTHTHDVIFPPTFSAKNNDPQFDGLKKLFGYVNRAGALLSDGVHVASVAVAYTAFAEWADLGAFEQLDKVARQLYDGHLNYDILSEDTLMSGVCVEDGKLLCNRESFHALIVPYAPRLPAALMRRLEELEKLGVSVIFIDARPLGTSCGEVVALEEIAALLKKRGYEDAVIEDNEFLRYYHCVDGKRKLYMFFNEYATDAVDTRVHLSDSGSYLRLDLLNGVVTRGESKNGELNVKLTPYESVIYIFGDFGEEESAKYPEATEGKTELPVPKSFAVYTASYENTENFTHLADTEEFFDITARDRLPDFSGVIKYKATLEVEKEFGGYTLDLGDVGSVTAVRVNGKDCGLAICAPYAFELGEALEVGKNELEILVYTSLANAMRSIERWNQHSREMASQIPFKYCGIRGPIQLFGHS